MGQISDLLNTVALLVEGKTSLGLLIEVVGDSGHGVRTTKHGGSGGIVVCGWLRFINSQSELQSHNKDGLDTFEDKDEPPLHHLLLYRLTDIPAVSLS